MKSLPRYPLCFVCGRDNACGLDMTFYKDGDTITARFIGEERHIGYPGQLHGGLISAMLDEAMGWAAVCARGRMAYSGEITIRFNRPLPPGTEVKVKAWLEEDRKRLLIARGQIEDGDGNIYARGRGKYFPIDEEAHRRVMELLYVEGQEDRPVTEDDF